MIQAVLVYSTKELETINKMDWKAADIVDMPEYWVYVEKNCFDGRTTGIIHGTASVMGKSCEKSSDYGRNVCTYVDFLADDLQNMIILSGF